MLLLSFFANFCLDRQSVFVSPSIVLTWWKLVAAAFRDLHNVKTLNPLAFIHTSIMLRPYLVRRILQFNRVHLQLPNGSRSEGEGMDRNISVVFFF